MFIHVNSNIPFVAGGKDVEDIDIVIFPYVAGQTCNKWWKNYVCFFWLFLPTDYKGYNKDHRCNC